MGALGAEVVPISRSGAGAIGIGAIAPPPSCPPNWPPAGAAAKSPRGRSDGENADRCTVSAYPDALLLATVTRSETGAGVSPEAALPKLMLGRSRAMERTGWMSMSTAAFSDTPRGGGEPPEQGSAGVAELRGAGADAEKSLEFVSVSVQPFAARIAAVVLLIAGAGPPPS